MLPGLGIYYFFNTEILWAVVISQSDVLLFVQEELFNLQIDLVLATLPKTFPLSVDGTIFFLLDGTVHEAGLKRPSELQA